MNEQEVIAAELARRQALRRAIRAIVLRDFAVLDGKYTRRGVVQQHVAKHLGVTQNNLLAREVIALLASEGCKQVEIHGRHYFKHLCAKEFAVEQADVSDERL